MTIEIPTKTFAVWIGILILAIVNGALLEAMLIPAPGTPSGFILSGAILSGLILAVVYFSLSWIGRAPATCYVVVGLAGLCLSLMCEFIFGRVIQCKPRPKLLEAHTFMVGIMWPIALLIAAISPYVSYP